VAEAVGKRQVVLFPGSVSAAHGTAATTIGPTAAAVPSTRSCLSIANSIRRDEAGTTAEHIRIAGELPG
jgi:hypothetical protein